MKCPVGHPGIWCGWAVKIQGLELGGEVQSCCCQGTKYMQRKSGSQGFGVIPFILQRGKGKGVVGEGRKVFGHRCPEKREFQRMKDQQCLMMQKGE